MKIENVSKTFKGGRKALDQVSFEIHKGECVALIGMSGSGKSTLLRCIAGLDTTDSNESKISVFGKTVQKNGKLASNIRHVRSHHGFVFQHFNLVERLPLITNVMMGGLSRISWYRSMFGIFTKAEIEKAKEALAEVGLSEFAWQRAGSLSGGQQQRGAIAKALMQDVDVLFADEPIASLDPASAREVIDLLKRLNAEKNITILVSLHQIDFAFRVCPRALVMREGKLIYDGDSKILTQKELDGFYKKDQKYETNTDECVKNIA